MAKLKDIVTHVFYGRKSAGERWRLIDVFFAERDAIDDAVMWVPNSGEAKTEAAVMRVTDYIPITLPIDTPKSKFIFVHKA